MKRKIIISSIVVVVIALVYYFFFYTSNDDVTYTFGEVTKGNLDVVITSSGTLEATSTVDVGTQVSGKITKLLVDFNSEVKKGQLIAVLDTTTLAAQVRDAQATLEKSKAEYDQKKIIHEKNKQLYEKKYISELDFISSQTDVESALATLKSAQYALEKAQTNLDYAYIYAPISGKVIDRSVEEGQTVAASYSTPTLFTIAEDLTKMRILADVDESDIGEIKEGQKVTFTVQTYSDKTFEGKVTQIRLQSTVTSNVVNYTVVIQADNSGMFLLPGMTATIDFYVNSRENVLLVPNTALRYQPDDDQLETLMKNMKTEMENMPDSIKAKFRNQKPPDMSSANGGATVSTENMKKVYYLDDNGKLKMSPVITGLTDGKNTEIVTSRELKEGMKIIIGSETGTTTTKSSNSLTSPSNQGGPPPMMM